MITEPRLERTSTVLELVAMLKDLHLDWVDFGESTVRENLNAQMRVRGWDWKYLFTWKTMAGTDEQGRKYEEKKMLIIADGETDVEKAWKVEKLYELVTHRATPAWADEPFAFSVRVLSQPDGVEKQTKKKREVLMGYTQTTNGHSADYTWALGQGIHEFIRKRAEEESEIPIRDGMVWAALDFVGSDYIIQLKTSEHGRLYIGAILETGWEAAAQEKRTGKKYRALLVLVYRNDAGKVDFLTHELSEAEKQEGYDTIQKRAEECRDTVAGWVNDPALPMIAREKIRKAMGDMAMQVRLQ